MIDLSLVLPVLAAALFGVHVGRNADTIGTRWHLLDIPDPMGGRKRHNRITPLVGGPAVLLPCLVAMLLMTLSYRGFPMVQITLQALLVLTASAAAMGLLDDRFGLSPQIRLVGLVSAFTFGILSAPEFSLNRLNFASIDQTIELSWWGGVGFSVLCLVGLVNAVNMADGKNGLVIGMALIWTALLATAAPAWLLPVLAVLGTGLAVALVFNAQGRLFLGDSGSYGLAALTGMCAILLHNIQPDRISAEQIMLWFLVPTVDCVRLIAFRTLRGRSPFAAGRDHLHHHIASRMDWRVGLFLYLALLGIPGLASVIRPDLTPMLIGGTLLAYLAVLAATSLPARSTAS